MATILTKRSNTASSVPLAADLTNSTSGAELAVNTADKKLYVKDGSGNVVELTGLKSTDIGVSVQAYDAQLNTLATASADRSTFLASEQAFSMRNRIINGDMRIDQRNAGASVTPTNGSFTLDRWQTTASQASKFSVQQVTTAPAGFTHSLKATSLSAYTVGASESFRIQQPIEGFNVADLGWGTASAQSVTLSFRVYSSLTGTFGGSITDSATAYSYPFSYTVSAANTWTTITVNISGPTSGTWGTTNGVGLYVVFSLGAGASVSGTAGAWASGFYASATGATSVVGTNGATFYITGVQLEAGTVATPFERRPYGTELALCQRYYGRGGVKIASGSGSATSATIFFKSEMRAAPTMTYGNSPQGAGTFLPAGNDWVSTSEAAPYTSTPSLNCSWTASAEL